MPFVIQQLWDRPSGPQKLDQVQKVTSLRVCLVRRERWALQEGLAAQQLFWWARAHLSLWGQEVLKASTLKTPGAYTADYCSPFSLSHYSHFNKLVTPADSEMTSRKNSQFTDHKLA